MFDNVMREWEVSQQSISAVLCSSFKSRFWPLFFIHTEHLIWFYIQLLISANCGGWFIENAVRGKTRDNIIMTLQRWILIKLRSGIVKQNCNVNTLWVSLILTLCIVVCLPPHPCQAQCRCCHELCCLRHARTPGAGDDLEEN